ncbi:NAD(P)H nitroreductase [Hoyosella rhizosphaerae]|nr:NAD(P)H nitroreductase [Hoyosella rhizosphaerae]MBN4926052.1 NAD(P)H nitroreductase [Hoyosella rhizosphaerae]
MSEKRSEQDESLRQLVGFATRAPSIHNTQPWTVGVADNAITVFADPERQMRAADPSGRQMIISCGAFVHHLDVVLHNAGFDTAIHRFPNTDDTTHVATIELKPARYIDEKYRSLAGAVTERRSDRRPLGPLSDEAVETLTTAFHDDSVSAVAITGGGTDLFRQASELAIENRLGDENYLRELNWWSGHYRLFEGVPRSALVSSATQQTVPSNREFPVGTLDADRKVEDEASLLVLSTSSDDQTHWLRSGEAMSAIMLDATVSRLGCCPVTHVTELDESRALIRSAAAESSEMYRYPQAVIRVGERRDDSAPPASGRRPVDEIIRR